MRKVLLACMMVLPLWAQAQSPSVVVSASVPTATNPMLVPSITVVISDTAGYARDAALEKAARMALPKVLTGPVFQLNSKDIAPKLKSLGSAMPFVARYSIKQERVLPTYSMVVDMTFNEAKLRQNFGGIKVQVGEGTGTVAVSATMGAMAQPTAAPTAWLVRVNEPTAAGQDRARRALNALANTRAVVQEVARTSITFKVMSAQPQNQLAEALAGWNPVIAPYAATPVERVNTTPAAPRYQETYAQDPAATPTAAPAQTPTVGRNAPAWLPDLW